MTQNPNLELFLQTCCELVEDFLVPKQSFYSSYLAWYKEQMGDEPPLTKQSVGKLLPLLGVTEHRKKDARFWKGLRILKTETTKPLKHSFPETSSEETSLSEEISSPRVTTPRIQKPQPHPSHNAALETLLLRNMLGVENTV